MLRTRTHRSFSLFIIYTGYMCVNKTIAHSYNRLLRTVSKFDSVVSPATFGKFDSFIHFLIQSHYTFNRYFFEGHKAKSVSLTTERSVREWRGRHVDYCMRNDKLSVKFCWVDLEEIAERSSTDIRYETALRKTDKKRNTEYNMERKQNWLDICEDGITLLENIIGKELEWRRRVHIIRRWMRVHEREDEKGPYKVVEVSKSMEKS